MRVGALALAALGCATTGGYASPRPDVAMLETDDTKIDELDGQPSAFSMGSWRRARELPPGPHTLGASVFVVRGGPEADGSDFRRSQSRILCFEAQAGHSYVVRPVPDGTFRVPELYDATTRQVIRDACARDGARP